MCPVYTRAWPDVHTQVSTDVVVAHVHAVIGLQRCFTMYAIACRTSLRSIAIAAVLCGACSSQGSGGELTPDAGRPDSGSATDAPEVNPLDAFSAPSKEHFHLVASGKVSDGRARVYYAPKVMYLEARGTTPQLSALIVTGSSNGERRYLLGGSFAWSAAVDAEPLAQLQREATGANVAVLRADIGLPHLVCGATETMFPPVFATACVGDPRIVNFGFIAWQATQPREVTLDTAKAAIDAHLADGSAWSDVLAGDLTWHVPGGEVLHTRLEISCIGQLFDPDGNPAVTLFDSPACRARYTRP
jgi:hypothetical protein